jgi:16S rRNA (cytosine1402-N4)-methyltransferase
MTGPPGFEHRAEPVSTTSAEHVPVLPEPVRELLNVARGESVLDLTVGQAGHARMLGDAAGADGVLIGLDVDARNLETAMKRLSGCPARTRLFHANFAQFDEVLEEAGVRSVDVMLVDLGVSSNQLADPQRGFSFAIDGPLDMRLDDRLTRTAADLVNGLKEDELSDLIYFNSQERFSRRIARRICEVRRARRITTTGELCRAVCTALGVDPESRPTKIHPATRTFLALRMTVNDEIGALQTMLDKAPGYLNPGGRIGVIAFHSVEDAAVKRDFARRKREGTYRILTKRPVTAGPAERKANPRSRSAKLRVAAVAQSTATNKE